MIPTAIIALPALAALIVCLTRGPEKALLNVYLPTLLLLPHSFGWTISGQLPFGDPAIAVICLFFLLQHQRRSEWSAIGFLVVGYLVITVVSQGINLGYKLGQNLALKELCAILLPYYAIRKAAQRPQFATDLAK